MKRTVLLRLAALVVALAAIAIVAVVAYNLGVANAPGAPVMRGMRFDGHEMGWGGYGPGFGLLGLLGFVVIGVLVIWLLAALLSPDGGGRRPVGPAAGDVERLRELSDMHTAGKLTDDEFAAAKRKILGLP
ncbi:MAG: SHOCT domain-containing protein [Candidatus Limnocylindrales bacterium]